MFMRRTLLICVLLFAIACGGKQEKKDALPLPGQTNLIVKQFVLDGVKQFSVAEIKGGLKTRESTWRSKGGVRWMPVLGQDRQYFNYVHWRQDLDRIRTYYAARGYFGAKIVSESITENPEEGTIRLAITVSEGSPTLIDEIVVDGLETAEVPSTRLMNAVPMGEGDVFRESDYAAAKRSLRTQLENAGYAYATVEGRVVVQPKELSASLYFFVDPGPRSRFGEVEIEGYDDVPESAIREAITFESGDRYSPDELQETQERIYDLGVFSVVKVNAQTSRDRDEDLEGEDVDAPQSQYTAGGLSAVLDEAQAEAEKRASLNPVVGVKIRVTEAKLWNVRVGAGGAAEIARQDLHGRLDWSSRNFLGGLRKLEQFNSVGYAWAPGFLSDRALRNEGVILDTELRFTQPQFIERFTKLETRLRFERHIEPGYTLLSPSAKIGLRRKFFNHLTAEISYNFLLFLLSDVNESLLDPTLRLQPEYILEYLQQRIVYDRRNNFLNPSRGFLVEAQLEEATSYVGRLPGVPTGGHFDYVSPSLGAEAYFPYRLFLTQVLALRARVATIYNLGDKQPPIPQRMYSGGADSMRSFGRQRLSLYSLTGEAIPIGGLTRVETSIEPRFRVVKKMLDVGDFWMAPFLDAATVLPGPLGFSRDDAGPDPAQFSDVTSTLLYGVGLGAWWLTPVGPLRLDFAYTLSNLTDDPRFRRCAVETDSPAECPGDFVPLAQDPIQQRINKWNIIVGIAHSF